MEGPGQLILEKGAWIPTGGEDFDEVVDVNVEVVGLATDAPSPNGKGIRLLLQLLGFTTLFNI